MLLPPTSAETPVILFANEWSANYFGETNKNCPAFRADGAYVNLHALQKLVKKHFGVVRLCFRS